MAVEIRIESSWDVSDDDGRRVEVTVLERRHPSEDPQEDSRFFASGDTTKLKNYLCQLIDRKAKLFLEPQQRECDRCGRLVNAPEPQQASSMGSEAGYTCQSCRS